MVTTPSQKSKMALRKGKWRPEEDHKLICYIRRYGIWNWNEMPRAAGLSRSGKSCRLRWMNYLRPFIRHGNFSKEDEDTIFKLHEKLGNRWSAIAAKLPGRTDNDIKNYWNSNLRKRLRNTASATKLDGLQTSGGQLKKHLSEGTLPKEIPKSSSSNMVNKTDINQDVAHQNITAGLSKVSLDFKSLQGQSFSMEGLHIMEDNGKIIHPFASDDDLLGFFPPTQNIDFSGELQYLTWHEEPVYSYNYQDDLFEYPTLWYDEYQVIEENNNNELSELSGELFQSLWEQQSCPIMEDLYTAQDESEREGPGHPFEDFPACYSNQLSSGEIQFLWDYPFLL